jgi:hypothetical protein
MDPNEIRTLVSGGNPAIPTVTSVPAAPPRGEIMTECC